MTAETGGQTQAQSNGSGSAFDSENFPPVVLIQLMRLYDLGLALLSAVNPKKAGELVELHANGHTFCPAPRFIEYEDVDETQV